MTEKEVKVSKQHVWAGIEDRHVHLGVTNYIQGALGAVISVELPDVGDPIEEGELLPRSSPCPRFMSLFHPSPVSC